MSKLTNEAIERAALGTLDIGITQELTELGHMIDAAKSADSAGVRFNQAKKKMWKERDRLRKLDDTDPPPPPPDPDAFNFTSVKTPFTPTDSKQSVEEDILAPAGEVATVELTIEMTGITRDITKNNLLCWFTGRKQNGDHFGKDQAFYGFTVSDNKFTWRQGIGTEQGPPPLKTKDTAKPARWDQDITVLRFFSDYRDGTNWIEWNGQHFNGSKLIVADASNPYTITQHGMKLSLSGVPFNDGETWADGVTFKSAVGRITYV